MKVEEAVVSLRGQGIKVTPQRRGIIQVMATAARPLTVQEIYQQAKEAFPEMSQDTVYRTLDMLVRLQVAAPLHLADGQASRYELQNPENPHHHLVCLGCGESFCLQSCPLTHSQLSEARELHFTVKQHALEFYGYCEKCTPDIETGRNVGPIRCHEGDG